MWRLPFFRLHWLLSLSLRFSFFPGLLSLPISPITGRERQRSSNVPEDERPRGRGRLHIHPTPQHHPSAGDDDCLVNVQPASSILLHFEGLVIDALNESEADTLPATEPPIGSLDILNEAEGVVGLDVAMYALLSFEGDTLDVRALERGDKSAADVRPKQVLAGLKLESLGSSCQSGQRKVDLESYHDFHLLVVRSTCLAVLQLFDCPWKWVDASYVEGHG